MNIVDDVAGSLKKLLDMQTASNITLQDIRERQKRLENAIKSIKSVGLNPLDSDDSLIVELLPLATVDNMKEFESLLKTSNEAVTQFVSLYIYFIYFISYTFMFFNTQNLKLHLLQKQFLLKIGGNNPRDNIHRILKKIFTNGCAVNCSWKGVRKNFRLDNLHFIKIIRSM